MPSPSPDVLVVGAGPVGLASALCLAHRGLRVDVIDEQWRTTARSYALALHPSSLVVLDALGLAQRLIGLGKRIDVLAIYRGAERQAEVRFDKLDAPFPFLLVLPQSQLEQALEARLRDHGVSVRWNHRFSLLHADSTRAVSEIDRLEKESSGYGIARSEWVVRDVHKVTSSFVVGADGYRSAVRRDLGATFDASGTPSQYAVFEVASGYQGPEEARMVLDDDGVSVCWPLGEGRFRWSFPLQGNEALHRRSKSRVVVDPDRAPFPHMGVEELQAHLARRAPWFDGPIGEVAWSLAMQFEQRLASNFGQGRVWLAGDAAHVAAPIGVHSMNYGMLEAQMLGDAIHDVQRNGAGPSRLEAYARDARAPWARPWGDDATAASQTPASSWIQQESRRIASCLPASGQHLQSLLAQLGLRAGSA